MKSADKAQAKLWEFVSDGGVVELSDVCFEKCDFDGNESIDTAIFEKLQQGCDHSPCFMLKSGFDRSSYTKPYVITGMTYERINNRNYCIGNDEVSLVYFTEKTGLVIAICLPISVNVVDMEFSEYMVVEFDMESPYEMTLYNVI